MSQDVYISESEILSIFNKVDYRNDHEVLEHLSYKYFDIKNDQTEEQIPNKPNTIVDIDFENCDYSVHWQLAFPNNTSSPPRIESSHVEINSEDILRIIFKGKSVFKIDDDPNLVVFYMSKFSEVREMLKDEKYYCLMPNYCELDSTYRFWINFGSISSYNKQESATCELSNYKVLYKKKNFISNKKRKIRLATKKGLLIEKY